MAATQTSAQPEISAAVAPAPHPTPATNHFAPPRLTNQILSGNKKRSTSEAFHQKEHYTGTPRLAGTVVQKSTGGGSRKVAISTLSTVSELSDELMVSDQTGGNLAQPAAMDSTSVAQATEGPFEMSDIASDFRVPGVLAILAISALGIWGAVRFVGYWKSLNPSSWAAGGGIYSDDSQGSSSEREFSKVFRQRPNIEEANGNGPKQVHPSDETEKNRHENGHEADGARLRSPGSE